MDALAAIDLPRFVAAGLHLLPTLVWAILALSYWRSHGTERPQGQLLRLFRVLCGLLAVHYGLNIVIDLDYPAAGEAASALWLAGCVLTRGTTLAELAVLRHLVPLATLGGTPPGRLWLAVNYGSALLVGVASAWLGTFSDFAATLVHVYLLAMTAAIVVDVVRLARRRGGRWRPVIMADLGPSGFTILGLAMFAGVVAIVIIEQSRPGPHLAWATIHASVGLALAAIFASRILGEVVRRFLVAAGSIAAAAAIYFGARFLSTRVEGGVAWLVDLGGVLALLLALGPGVAWLRAAVDRVVLHQSRRWDEQLQSFLQTLSPELGVAECRRRAVAEVARVLKLRGAALLLAGSGDETGPSLVTDGRIELRSLAEVWPAGSAARQLPERAFDLLWLEDVELQEALHDAEITWVVPVTSPRRSWGHLFVCAGPFGIAAAGAKLETLEGFTRQLALALDSADLLGRAVAVERELAQAEKLAAVGEMAARVAHEIRNPLTAARSLAQTLAREPTSPANAEHAGIILRELDRVEHQVRSLLEYARRETYRFEPVRLADLVRATLGDLCLEVADGRIDLVLELDSGVQVRADPERLRQVLINLVENAVDALGEAAGPRRLTIAVAGAGGAAALGAATLEVRDSGPGVAEELLPRLFEPFVSDKARGTGLGLAIARRIVEAHGGRIEAEPAPGGGSVFRVTLPGLESVGEPAAVAVDLERTA